MLEFVKGRVVIKMVHNATVDYVFQEFGCYGGEGNGSIVLYPSSVSLFVDRDNKGLLPGLGDAALV